MSSNEHILQYQGKPAFVVIPYEEYKELIKLKESFLSDEELYTQAIARSEEYFPEELINRILNAENSIKVYREYREFTQENLAQKIGKTKQYISSIEKGQRKGTLATLKKIAYALDVDLDMLN